MIERLLRLSLRRARQSSGRAGEAWTILAALAVGVRVLRWLARPRPEVLTETLKPGDTLVITNRRQPS